MPEQVPGMPGWTFADDPKSPPPPQAQTPQSDSAALALQAGGSAVPVVQRTALNVATSPTLRGTLGDVGATTGAVSGLAKGSPITAYVEAKIGGKIGRAVAPSVQRFAAPLARALEAIEPYAQTASTLSGAQGVNDLAQMAEPQRKDIGFMGVALNAERDPNHPALLNLLAMKAGDGIKALMAEGLSLGEAARAYWNAKAKTGK